MSRQIAENSTSYPVDRLLLQTNSKERARQWKPKKTIGVYAHDVTTTFPCSSIASPVVTCRTGGRGRPRSTRHAGKRRRRELVNERRNVLSFHQQRWATAARSPQACENGQRAITPYRSRFFDENTRNLSRDCTRNWPPRGSN